MSLDDENLLVLTDNMTSEEKTIAIEKYFKTIRNLRKNFTYEQIKDTYLPQDQDSYDTNKRKLMKIHYKLKKESFILNENIKNIKKDNLNIIITNILLEKQMMTKESQNIINLNNIFDIIVKYNKIQIDSIEQKIKNTQNEINRLFDIIYPEFPIIPAPLVLKRSIKPRKMHSWSSSESE